MDPRRNDSALIGAPLCRELELGTEAPAIKTQRRCSCPKSRKYLHPRNANRDLPRSVPQVIRSSCAPMKSTSNATALRAMRSRTGSKQNENCSRDSRKLAATENLRPLSLSPTQLSTRPRARLKRREQQFQRDTYPLATRWCITVKLPRYKIGSTQTKHASGAFSKSTTSTQFER